MVSILVVLTYSGGLVGERDIGSCSLVHWVPFSREKAQNLSNGLSFARK